MLKFFVYLNMWYYCIFYDMWSTEKCPRQKLLENNQQYLIIKAVKLGQFPRQCLVRLAPVLKTGGGDEKKSSEYDLSELFFFF